MWKRGGGICAHKRLMKSSGVSSTECVPSFHVRLNRTRTPAVGMLLESVERQWWARDVATEALESPSVATAHHDLGVDIDPADFGQRALARFDEPQRADELGSLLSRGRSEHLHVGRRRAVARREHGLVIGEGVGRVADAFEGAAVTLEHAQQTRVVHAATCATSSVVGALSTHNCKRPSSSRTYTPSSAGLSVEPIA